MIKITVELWPLGSKTYKRHLGTTTIANVGTGTPGPGDYEYSISSFGVFREGKITGFPRMKLGIWDLLLRILKDAYGSK